MSGYERMLGVILFGLVLCAGARATTTTTTTEEARSRDDAYFD